MRELFVEELESVVGGQKLEIDDYVQSTMACCEEGVSCCWWWEAIEDLSIAIRP